MKTLKKSVQVTLKKGKHKSQPWTCTIDMPGPQEPEKRPRRYATRYSAWRSALRKLNAESSSGLDGRMWNYVGGYSWYHRDAKGQLIPIIFTTA